MIEAFRFADAKKSLLGDPLHENMIEVNSTLIHLYIPWAYTR